MGNVTTDATRDSDSVSTACGDKSDGYNHSSIRMASWLQYVSLRVVGYPRFDDEVTA